MSIDHDEIDVNAMEEAAIFPAGDACSPLVLCGYRGFVVSGCVLTFFAVLIIVIEVAISVRASLVSTMSALVFGCVSFIHVLNAARSPGEAPWYAWVAFAVSIGVLIPEVWLVVTDLTAKIVLSSIAGIGGASLFAARVLLAGYGERWSGKSRPVQIFLAVAGWVPLALLVALFFK